MVSGMMVERLQDYHETYSGSPVITLIAGRYNTVDRTIVHTP
jgi:hypothetical protein